MRSNTITSAEPKARRLEDVQVPVRLKLSALWVSAMFLYVYVDIFALYEPGTIDDILVGRVWEFDISQAWALSALVLMTIPTLMVFLSLALPARLARSTNLVVASSVRSRLDRKRGGRDAGLLLVRLGCRDGAAPADHLVRMDVATPGRLSPRTEVTGGRGHVDAVERAEGNRRRRRDLTVAHRSRLSLRWRNIEEVSRSR